MSEMFNRNAIGVRAYADGVGVKRSNVSSEAVQGIIENRLAPTSIGDDNVVSGGARSELKSNLKEF